MADEATMDLFHACLRLSAVDYDKRPPMMILFRQQIDAGMFKGDELRALVENVPYLTHGVLRAEGVDLHKAMRDGLLAEQVTVAMFKRRALIEEENGKVGQTWGEWKAEVHEKTRRFIDAMEAEPQAVKDRMLADFNKMMPDRPADSFSGMLVAMVNAALMSRDKKH